MKPKKIFLTLATVLICTVAFGQVKVSNTGSPHNFMNGPGKIFSTEICNVCHTPHNADKDTLRLLPLWNHLGSTSTAFQMYQSSTMNTAYGTGASATMVSSTSKLCLGCHDGASNMDAYGNSAGTTANRMTAGVPGNFGTDLRNDHPVSRVYSHTADSTLYNADTRNTVLGGTLRNDMLLGGTTVECTSCHALHGLGTAPKLLRITTVGSVLCLTCHIK